MNLSLMSPEIFLSLAGLAFMAGEGFWRGSRRAWLSLGLFSALVTLIFVWDLNLWYSGEATARLVDDNISMGMFIFDPKSAYFKLILLAATALVLVMSMDYRLFDDKLTKSWGTYAALLLFSTVGLMLLVSSTDFLMILISLELVSITSFILTGFMRKDQRSTEGAIKFFLVGAFSSGLMIYGISLYYGIFGTTSVESLSKLTDISALPRIPLLASIFFILAGLGFKMAMAPFHMWAPDAYEGAPTPITAYLSVAPKAAAFGALLRILPNHPFLGISTILAVLAAVTMTVGNLSALKQSNVKRLMGFSSIAQMGYVLAGVVSAGNLGVRSVLIYSLAYIFMNLGAFACIIAVTNEAGSDDVDAFLGLTQRSFPLALITTVFLLSLTGIPPLVGFIGKFSIFSAAVSSGWTWLAFVGLLNSVASFYYYFNLVYKMFFKPSSNPNKVHVSMPLAGCAALTLIVTVFVGLFPNSLLTWVGKVVP